jgi:hypothetical protein
MLKSPFSYGDSQRAERLITITYANKCPDKYPTSESELIAGRLCFNNVMVEVFIDGVKEK